MRSGELPSSTLALQFVSHLLCRCQFWVHVKSLSCSRNMCEESQL